MARRKSAYDLAAQYNRIKQIAGAGSVRERKALNIYKRYDTNITNSKSYQNTSRRYDWDNMSDEEFYRRAAQLDGRKYSQRTYMGLNAG